MNKKVFIVAGGIGVAIIILLVLFTAKTPTVNEPKTSVPPSSPQQADQSLGEDVEIVLPTSPSAQPETNLNPSPKPVLAPSQPIENPAGPQLAVTSPAQGAILSGPIIINADANDKDSVSKVEFYVNGKLISADTYVPYSASYDTLQSGNGKATIVVKAYDRLGNVQQKNLSVTFNNPPTFQLLSVSPQRLNEGEQLTVKWSVAVAHSCVASGAWSGTKGTSGNETLTALGSGKFVLTCSGAGGTETKEANLDVTPSLPVLSITAPASGAIIRGTLTVTANAVDNTGINKVEFYFGDTLFSTDTIAPYTATYDTTSAEDLKYTIRVRAYDRASNSKEESISISTSNGNY